MMAEKWIPLDGSKLRGAVSAEPTEWDGEGNVISYRVWLADRTEPLGNPIQFKTETLRKFFKPEDEGGGE